MTVSKPSQLVYYVDVPEVLEFEGNFIYNFFVPDESVNADSVLPISVTQRPSTESDTTYEAIVKIKAPRYCKFTWRCPIVSANTPTQTLLQKNRDLIKTNLTRILTEDQFSTYTYTSILFNDSDVDKKIYNTVSASLDLFSLDFSVTRDTTGAKLGSQLNKLLEGGLTHDDLVNSVTAFDNTLIINNNGKQQKSKASKLGRFNIHAQINSVLLSDILQESAVNPLNQHNATLYELQDAAAQLKQLNNNAITLSDQEFLTNIPILDAAPVAPSSVPDAAQANIVGFIIDKQEITKDGTIIEHDPIIVESPTAATNYDFSVKYGSSYVYSIRTIALYQLVAFNAATLAPGLIRFLVSSKPSQKIKLDCLEFVAPPPPTDVKLDWNYDLGKLQISWSFPVNSQRDIKKFQIFRRKSLNEAFELLKIFDFNDAAVQVEYETPRPELVAKSTSPVMFYIDDDFTKSSYYIYALCSIDAHGMTSCNSTQFGVSFDNFKNKTSVKLLSHSGAPKHYPNFFIENSLFSDTIKTSGDNAKKMTLYFNPVCFSYQDDNGSIHEVVKTQKTNSFYKLNMINLDNQSSAEVNIKIEDRSNSLNSTQK